MNDHDTPPTPPSDPATRTATPFLQAEYPTTLAEKCRHHGGDGISSGCSDCDTDDTVPLLPAKHDPESDSPLLMHQLRRRHKRFCSRCCVVSTVVTFVTIVLVAIPVLYYLVVPQVVRHAIATAPPPNIRRLDMDRLWVHNQSISVDVDAYFEISPAPAVRMYGSTFSVGIILPHETAVRHLAMADFGDMLSTGWNEPLNLQFRASMHSFNVNNTRRVIATAFRYIESGPDGGVEGDPYAKLVLVGNAVAHIFGIDFPSTQFRYVLPLKLDLSNLLSKFDPQVVPDDPTDDNPDDDGDDDDNVGSLSASILNPTPYGFNLGAVNMTAFQPASGHPFAYLLFTPLALPFLNLSKNNERAILSAKLGLIMDDDDSSPLPPQSGLSVLIKGDHVQMLGYGGEHERILWFEELFHGLELRISAPA